MTCEVVKKLLVQCLREFKGCPSLRLRVGNQPGWRVESTIFFACHNSGVIDFSWPCLYADMSFFAFSRPAVETKSVLISNVSSNH